MAIRASESIFGATTGVSFWWNRGVKRSLNNDLDLIPCSALQAGGRRFDPGHVHQTFLLSPGITSPPRALASRITRDAIDIRKSFPDASCVSGRSYRKS